jgi:mRNA interferase MazF
MQTGNIYINFSLAIDNVLIVIYYVFWGAIDVPQKGASRGLLDIKWGEVYYADLPVKEHSVVQGGRRPVVVVSNNVGNAYSSAINIVPLTSNLKKTSLPTHVQVDCLPRPSMALCEQPMTIDKHLLLNRVGVVPKNIMGQIINVIIHVQFSGDYQTAC